MELNVYFVKINFLINTLTKILISILLILIAFDSNKIKKLIKQLIFFYLVSFTFGGATFMLLFFISPQNIVMKENHLIGTYPLKVTIYGGILGFITIIIVSKIIKDRMSKKAMQTYIQYESIPLFARNKRELYNSLYDSEIILPSESKSP